MGLDMMALFKGHVRTQKQRRQGAGATTLADASNMVFIDMMLVEYSNILGLPQFQDTQIKQVLFTAKILPRSMAKMCHDCLGLISKRGWKRIDYELTAPRWQLVKSTKYQPKRHCERNI